MGIARTARNSSRIASMRLSAYLNAGETSPLASAPPPLFEQYEEGEDDEGSDGTYNDVDEESTEHASPNAGATSLSQPSRTKRKRKTAKDL
jgi:hypothetical protein